MSDSKLRDRIAAAIYQTGAAKTDSLCPNGTALVNTCGKRICLWLMR
jgi:hypothetical protein